MGVTFAPMALLPELFPTNVRYTGAASRTTSAGSSASIAPYIAQLLAAHGGLSWVGGYVSVAAAISLIGVLLMRETRRIARETPGRPGWRPALYTRSWVRAARDPAPKEPPP